MEYVIRKKVVDIDTNIETDNYIDLKYTSLEAFIDAIFTYGGKRGKQPAWCYAIRNKEIIDGNMVVQIDRDYRKVSKE